MKCHYEVLNVPQDASIEDLKKAYRKLVLQWHPDKNLNNAQECKEVFQLIQQAYDILSDPQERAWYDKHRDEILKGGENFKDDSLNVFQYFTTSCYSGYGDDEKGFFTIYRSIFETLAAEDTPFLDQDELMPTFGLSNSSYPEVVHVFYGHWQSYCTAKTYVWIEAYDIREGPNRRVVRLMEKENKKLRDQARKARNEEVRELVAFVRKRDPRVQAHKKFLEEKKAENARKAQDQRQKAILDRKKELSNYNESEWSNMSKLEASMQEIENQLDNEFGRDSFSETDEDAADCSDPEVSLEDSLYCIACDKIFQSEKAKLNHDQSKKHKENVTLLKEALEEEDKLQPNIETVDPPEKICGTESDDCNINEQLNGLTNSEVDSEAEELDTKAKSSRNARRKKKTVIIPDEDQEEEEMDEDQPNPDILKDKEESPPSSSEAKAKKKRRRAKQSKPAEVVLEEPKVETEGIILPEKNLCATCGNEFPTRNKLFTHLKTTRHSIYIGEKAAAVEKDSSEKRERGRKGKTKQREL